MQSFLGWTQLGPQQLKYTTVLKDSSDLSFSRRTLLKAEDEEEDSLVLAREQDLNWDLACW